MAYQDKLTGMVNSIAGSIGQLAISEAVKGQKEATELQTKAQEEAALKQEELTRAQTKAYQESTAASQASAAKSLQTQVALEAGKQSGYLTSPEKAFENTYHLTMNDAEQAIEGIRGFEKLKVDNPELASKLEEHYKNVLKYEASNKKDVDEFDAMMTAKSDYQQESVKFASAKAYQAAKEQTAKYMKIQQDPAKFIEEMIDNLKITDEFINKTTAARTPIDWSKLPHINTDTYNFINRLSNIRAELGQSRTTAELAKETIKKEDRK